MDNQYSTMVEVWQWNHFALNYCPNLVQQMKKVVEGHIDLHKTRPSCLLTRLTCLHRIDGIKKIAKNLKLVAKIVNHTRMFTIELY
jgi:hypothetical protein